MCSLGGGQVSALAGPRHPSLTSQLDALPGALTLERGVGRGKMVRAVRGRGSALLWAASTLLSACPVGKVRLSFC